jgi:C_GCAxxG_C_C family probable redox protein
MKSKSEVASEKFLAGYNCAQSVVYSFCDDLCFDKNTALKIACGFGAGMGLQGQICGAVSGGIMVLGTRYGRGEHDEPRAMEMTYAKTAELLHRFAVRQGTLLCRELIDGCDLSTVTGQKHFMEKDLLHQSCQPCVQSVVEILENLMK